MPLYKTLTRLFSRCIDAARRTLESVCCVVYRQLLPGRTQAISGSISAMVRLPAVVRTGYSARSLARWRRIILCTAVVMVALAHEVRTSALQAWLFSHWAERLSYVMGPGPSPRIAFPDAGPLDQRLGYTRIPEFQRRLEAQGYRVTAQMRFSTAAARLAAWGFHLPYQEPRVAGLVIRDKDGVPLYDSTLGHRIFHEAGEVPPLLLATLLFIENRRLQTPGDPRENPVVDWARLAKVGTLYAGRKLGLPLPVEGGSTLATQLEKFQHSQGGRTASPLEKLRQMTVASLKVYRDGTDTTAERQEILLRYLNTMPLAAAPGWGEVNGLADGLIAWFGRDPAEVFQALRAPSTDPTAVRAYKQILALLCAARGPNYYLVQNRPALEARAASYTGLLQTAGVIDGELARRVRAMPLGFLGKKAPPPARLILQQKAINHLRVQLERLLGESNPYTLDRLQLEVASTLDRGLQEDVTRLFDDLRDPVFLARHGLLGEHLLGGGDPGAVVYTFLLLERTPLGNLVRVHTDTADASFDLNDGMKMELGSTAKLRTLAHYLEIMADLYTEYAPLDTSALVERTSTAHDPFARWAAQTLRVQPGLSLEGFLEQALNRKYSANPGEMFFTGGGVQSFSNFERAENSRIYSVREGLIHSVNLVYIRLMRDIVQFHEARLPYDAFSVLSAPDNPTRRRLLEEIAEQESQDVLEKAYHAYRFLRPQEVEARLLGRHATDLRHMAMLFYAWHPGAGREALGQWLEARVSSVPPEEVRRLEKAYGNPQLNLADYAFLLGRPPLEVWAAGRVANTPGISWKALVSQSGEARRIASAWLFKTRNRRAQDLRLRIRIEQDAFTRMTPAWRRLGFPFEHLVPSLATAIGSSSDRPVALADLMGVILNDGVRLSTIDMRELHFAADTPYATNFERALASEERVMPAAVARLLRPVLAGVVKEGTAIRAADAFVDAQGMAIPLGGKTGSGDNRFKTFARGGGVASERPVSRTAAFVFYLGEKYFGVITAAVNGRKASEFGFTSSLPVALLRLLAPTLEAHLDLIPHSWNAFSPGVPSVRNEVSWKHPSPHSVRPATATLESSPELLLVPHPSSFRFDSPKTDR